MPKGDESVITGREAYAKACLRLKDAGFSQEAAGREVMELLAFCLEENKLKLLLDFDEAMAPDAARRFAEAVSRLADDEPMAYITGSQSFGHLDVRVAPGVLIPRPDTMVLVDQVLARLEPETDARILELGCGSGAAIAAIALERPRLSGLAVDIDALAIETTKVNLKRYGLEPRIQAIQGSWFEPVAKMGKFRLILSNPPYITTTEMDELPESVKKEPKSALWGGEDGLDCYRQILPAAFEMLEDDGWCLVEIGWKQGAAVKAMLESAGFNRVEIYRDDGDRDRVAVGCKTATATGKNGVANAEPEQPAGQGRTTRYWRVADPADPRLKEAGRVIREGGLVAFPTETVYGLGANGLDEEAVAGIFHAKGRPADNPLILHVASVADARALASRWSEQARRLAEKLWPGPLTIVVPAAAHIPRIVTAGLDTVAIRYPSDPIALALIEAADTPIAAPSANISGRPSPTRAEHVLDDLTGKIDIVIDNGPCKVGLESTILDLSVEPPEILRPGDVTRAALIQIVGEIGEEGRKETATTAPKAPGMKYRHYAPKAPLVVLRGEPPAIAAYITGELSAELSPSETMKAGAGNSDKIGLLLCKETWALLAAGGISPDGSEGHYYARDMGSHDRPGEMGLLLYDALRACDQEGVGRIYAEACSAEGPGAAVLNRLRKAADNRVVSV